MIHFVPVQDRPHGEQTELRAPLGRAGTSEIRLLRDE